MDLKQIEKLMAAMERMQIKRVALKREGFEIEIEKEGNEPAVPPPTYMAPPSVAHVPMPAPDVKSKTPDATQPKESQEGSFITSPMVGTYYSAPSPDDPPFIKVGDRVEEGSVVCIIEAMKVMNEVKADVKGTVLEILVKNGEPVEFGTPIFRIDPE